MKLGMPGFGHIRQMREKWRQPASSFNEISKQQQQLKKNINSYCNTVIIVLFFVRL